MPDLDLDDELTRLRDEMRRSVPVPGFKTVRERAKQRVVRRRMQIGAAVAVLVVSVAVPALREGMRPDPAPEAQPPGAPAPSTMPKGQFITGVEFTDADANRGYAIRATCKGTPASCTDELLTTDDGTHWQAQRLPRPDTTPSWSRGNLHLLGPDEITVDWSISAALDGARISRAHSVDGGATWETVTVPSIVTDTVAEIPDGTALVETCAQLVGGGQKCAERGFAVLLPGSGESALLANRPPLTAMTAGSSPMFDGRWWVTGRDPKTNRWGIAISDDDGRTWTTTILDWRESVDPYGWSVVSQGGTLYATAIGSLPNISNGLQGIFRSSDGGRTWQQTWQPADGKQPRRVFSSTVAAEDGTLTINAPDGMYSSRDGGRTFTEVERRYPGYVGQTRYGYLASPDSGPNEFLISADGVNWRKIKIG